ncbi:DUF6227 family protein [Streptomyces clavuligerus]|uniref:DUF6227 family protein n=1 Tax=Streptomyces clavuligerus TaxID=1901 RepID=UPI00017FF454|nr:DUF6227 family protein [Streptomyces clavuligerus]ANW19751.1 hypothetical protein BB341_16745 [Streptomyces clavuligerus]AXU14365.1 hypothetical protein D1794_17490 [Streptomyces clavuligerus]EDY48398.1 conserved hypothetical protein [Streptomyces clavuligerus]MBY6304368.1 hypothetical protein [Streptomyces clavuligerus]QCS07139.1 hypothetical protein CRV15_16845 [Streptomyces clavuligerus]
MNDPYETTETHLKRLLGRALNSFELPDATVERLDSALAHASSLHSSHHSGTLDRATYRHAFLLSDGSSLVLWELVHSSGPDILEQHELYTEEAEVRLAASRLPAGFPGFADAGDPDEPAERERPGPFGTVPGLSGPPGALPGIDAEVALLAGVMATPPAALPRMYVPDNSADHARRVLRRAENMDRPGEETAGLLRSAFAHHITQVFARQCQVAGKDAGFTLYEHAFLLLDGAEVSLWEVEHTATPDGRHMCEVYEAEHTAREAMELRARVR